ncbi:MAG: chorismate synthase [Armatimonadetes bacterium]|nr:chorismate synthase [Armatimonadota bacterium]
MSSSFGQIFRITTWGESHGGGVGVVVDGCPPRLPITIEEIQHELDRRRPGQSKIVTQRKESDTVKILSGINENGLTLGTPISLLVFNEDQRSNDYDEMQTKYRPSHADYAYDQKYGIRAWQGGGRSSARETVGRVAAGAIAKKLLAAFGVEIVAFVKKVHTIQTDIDPLTVTMEDVESNIVRCPDKTVAEAMIEHIEAIRKEGNSVGGIITCVAKNVPAGWGEPVFDKLEADLGKAILSLPACKGIEFGGGFDLTDHTGLEVNDEFYSVDEQKSKKSVYTKTNNSGGIQGGISNGMPIIFHAAFKPTATVLRPQDTVDTDHEETILTGRGRHDPCVLPRAVPIVEAMAAVTLADHCLRQAATQSLTKG